MDFLGVMECKNDIELLETLGKLACFPDVRVEQQGFSVSASYSPSKDTPDKEVKETIAKLSSIVETIQTHGMCLF